MIVVKFRKPTCNHFSFLTVQVVTYLSIPQKEYKTVYLWEYMLVLIAMLCDHVAVVDHQSAHGNDALRILPLDKFVYKRWHCGNQCFVENIDVENLDALINLLLLFIQLFQQPFFDLV